MPGNGSARLVATLRACESRAAGGALTIGEVLDSVQEAGYAFICVFLVLPFLQPFSLGPLATVGGLTFAVLGWQCFRGHHVPVLPERVRRTAMGQVAWRRLLEVCVKLLQWCARFTRARRGEWVNGERGRRTIGLTLVAGGLLMAVPFFGIPFNNFLPALAIFFVCIAELEQDGTMVFVAFGWLLVTVLYFAAILLVLWFAGEQAVSFFG